MTLHPLARTNKTVNISKRNRIIQFGWRSGISVLDKFTLIKFFGIILILIRIIFLPIFLAQKSIDIIRANDPYYMGLIAYYFSKILRKPFVISIHSDYDKRYKLDGPRGSFTILGSRRVAKSLERFILKKSNYILPIRSYMIKVYNQGNLIPKKKFFIFS